MYRYLISTAIGFALSTSVWADGVPSKEAAEGTFAESSIRTSY